MRACAVCGAAMKCRGCFISDWGSAWKMSRLSPVLPSRTHHIMTPKIPLEAPTHHLVAAAHEDGHCLEVRAALHNQHLVLGGAKADLRCRQGSSKAREAFCAVPCERLDRSPAHTSTAGHGTPPVVGWER